MKMMRSGFFGRAWKGSAVAGWGGGRWLARERNAGWAAAGLTGAILFGLGLVEALAAAAGSAGGGVSNAVTAVGAAAGATNAAAGGATESMFQWRPFLAPFHAVVLHFPIGFVTMAAILEVYRWRRPSEALKGVSVLVLWLSLLTGIVAAAFGTLRAGSGEYEARMLELHRVYGLAVPVLTVGALVAQALAFRASSGRPFLLAYRGILGVTLVLLLVAGHYGGNLTHGSNYLTENAPQFVKVILEAELGADLPPQPEGAALSPGQQFYVDSVRPVLEAKCVRCHGPEKQKGEYRVDVAESALKGGDSGEAAIHPGDPMKSNLIRLILLPRDHDEVMPPAGKEPLTAEETMTVIRWIQMGAPFPTPAAGSSPPDTNSPSSTGQVVTTNGPGAKAAGAAKGD